MELNIKKVGIALGLVATLGSAVAALDQIEPVLPAHRLYVREQAAQPDMQRVLKAIQTEQAEGKLERVESDIAKAQIELNKAQEEPIRGFIGDYIKQLRQTRDRLEEQLKTLKK